jgi:hypothetical protein
MSDLLANSRADAASPQYEEEFIEDEGGLEGASASKNVIIEFKVQ